MFGSVSILKEDNCTEEHGTVGMVVMRGWLDYMTLVVFCNLNNSMILF